MEWFGGLKKVKKMEWNGLRRMVFPNGGRAFRGLSMEDLNDTDAFYLVRKGEMIGIYKSLTDCWAQAGSSQPASVGAQADDADDEDLSPERWEEAAKLIELVERRGFNSLRTTPQTEIVKQDSSRTSVGTLTVSSTHESAIGGSASVIPQTNIFKSDSSINFVGTPTVSSSCDTCIIEFDGASKGNPGIAGAGVLLRAADGSSVWRIREGLGLATNNVAEYRALLLGLRQALKKGFKHIHARGDSKLVVMQVQGKWKLKNANMAELCTEAKKLVDKFVTFQIEHVLREYNSAADAQANRAINVMDGQVEEDYQSL